MPRIFHGVKAERSTKVEPNKD